MKKFFRNIVKIIAIVILCIGGLAAAIKLADSMRERTIIKYVEVIAIEKEAFFAIGEEESRGMAEYITQQKNYDNVRVFDPIIVTNDYGDIIGWKIRTWTYPTEYTIVNNTEIIKN